MSIIKKEDYIESCCPLKRDSEFKPIPLARILDLLDKHVNAKEFNEAEKLLKYWISEAEISGDERGKLSLANEEIGLYRKNLKREKALAAAEEVLTLLDRLELKGSITEATSYINVATAYNAFENPELAYEYYGKAREIYEENLKQDDSRLGGLYNNMALAALNLDKYDEAKDLFEKAIDVMNLIPGGNLEVAITHCNIADLISARDGIEAGEKEIEAHIEEAVRLLDLSKDSTDGYYAFVCEKCAPVFGYYGYFIYRDIVQKRAEAIYERS